MDIVFKNAKETKLSRVELNRVAAPPPLCRSVEKPDKASASLELISRYGYAQYDDGMRNDDCC